MLLIVPPVIVPMIMLVITPALGMALVAMPLVILVLMLMGLNLRLGTGVAGLPVSWRNSRSARVRSRARWPGHCCSPWSC